MRALVGCRMDDNTAALSQSCGSTVFCRRANCGEGQFSARFSHKPEAPQMRGLLGCRMDDIAALGQSRGGTGACRAANCGQTKLWPPPWPRSPPPHQSIPDKAWTLSGVWELEGDRKWGVRGGIGGQGGGVCGRSGFFFFLRGEGGVCKLVQVVLKRKGSFISWKLVADVPTQ